MLATDKLPISKTYPTADTPTAKYQGPPAKGVSGSKVIYQNYAIAVYSRPEGSDPYFSISSRKHQVPCPNNVELSDN